MNRTPPAVQDERRPALEEALQGGFERLIDEAMGAKWTRAEASRALIALVDEAVANALADEEPKSQRDPVTSRARR